MRSPSPTYFEPSDCLSAAHSGAAFNALRGSTSWRGTTSRAPSSIILVYRSLGHSPALDSPLPVVLPYSCCRSWRTQVSSLAVWRRTNTACEEGPFHTWPLSGNAPVLFMLMRRVRKAPCHCAVCKACSDLRPPAANHRFYVVGCTMNMVYYYPVAVGALGLALCCGSRGGHVLITRITHTV